MEEIVEKMIASTVVATPYSKNTETTEAYINGARMMYDFLIHNPHLMKSEKAEKFYETCLFPSVINFN